MRTPSHHTPWVPSKSDRTGHGTAPAGWLVGKEVLIQSVEPWRATYPRKSTTVGLAGAGSTEVPLLLFPGVGDGSLPQHLLTLGHGSVPASDIGASWAADTTGALSSGWKEPGALGGKSLAPSSPAI